MKAAEVNCSTVCVCVCVCASMGPRPAITENVTRHADSTARDVKTRLSRLVSNRDASRVACSDRETVNPRL